MDHCPPRQQHGLRTRWEPQALQLQSRSGRRGREALAARRARRGRSRLASFQPDEEFVIYRTQTCISAGKCYRFMRRVIKNVSERLVKLMVQVNCMK